MTLRTSLLGRCIFTAILIAASAALTARGWDDDKRLVRGSLCADANGDLSKDQFPGTECLEGHSCVFCSGNNPVGVIVAPYGSGSGKLHNPVNSNCGGDRLIGVCTGSGGIDNCDLQNYTVDGTCSGVVKNYTPQNQGGGTDPP